MNNNNRKKINKCEICGCSTKFSLNMCESCFDKEIDRHYTRNREEDEE